MKSDRHLGGRPVYKVGSITSKIDSRKNTVRNRCIRKIESTELADTNNFKKRCLLAKEVARCEHAFTVHIPILCAHL